MWVNGVGTYFGGKQNLTRTTIPERSESNIDPGAKFHVANDVPYIRYVIVSVITIIAFAHYDEPKARTRSFGVG